MPVYLLHGFRWPRPLIRIHIILQNLDDAAAEWIVAPATTETLRYNFEELYPEAMQHLESLRFIEQYDPEDLRAASQPYAYVADVVHEIRLGVDVEEVRGKGVTNEQWGSMLELRDKLAPEEKVGWFVVVCGDEERHAPSAAGPPQVGAQGVVTYRERGMSAADSNYSSNSDTVSGNLSADSASILILSQRTKVPSPELQPKGFKKWLRGGSLSKRKRYVERRPGEAPI